jgi:hypothetical protein
MIRVSIPEMSIPKRQDGGTSAQAEVFTVGLITSSHRRCVSEGVSEFRT